MKIPKRYKYEYVCCVPNSLENNIIKEVKEVIGQLVLSEKEKHKAIEDASCSKICDLTDTIQIEYI